VPGPPESPDEDLAALDDGFRRVSRAPEPLALLRLRELLLDVSLGGSERLREGLAGFHSWRFLATLCGSLWTAGARRASPAARRLLRRRLRVLGARPLPIAEAAALPPGTAVHLEGVILPRRGYAAGARLWNHAVPAGERRGDVVDEGHDFLLGEAGPHEASPDQAGSGEAQTQAVACVIARGGYLINADALHAGERVSVFGFTDRVVEGARAAAFSRASLTFAVRSGDDLPLLLRSHQERARTP
jgi:hypothetical protein